MLSEWAMKDYQSACFVEYCQRGGGLLAVNAYVTKGLCKQQRVLGTPSSWARHLAQPDPERSWVLWTNNDTPGGKKRLLRKSSAPETSSATITAFRARIGLISHIQTHRQHATYQWCNGHHPRRMDEHDKINIMWLFFRRRLQRRFNKELTCIFGETRFFNWEDNAPMFYSGTILSV